jgi:hypothetical protein
MSIQAQIDVRRLLEEVNRILCDECRKKLADLELPIAQTVKIKDLMKG